DVSGLDESSLAIYRYDGSSWSALSSCTVDTGANTVSCTTTAFSDFGIFGDEATSTSSSSSGASGGALPWCSGPLAPGWNESLPDGGCGSLVRTHSSVAISTSDNTSETPGSPPAISLFDRDLSIGDSGDDVIALQTILINKGYTIPAGATGYFGMQTRSALSAFQTQYTITPAVGYFGPITRAVIERNGISEEETLEINSLDSFSFTRDLWLGDTGDDVAELQKLLIKEGFTIPAGATGYFGEQTRSALASFQEAHTINPPQGYFGFITRTYLSAR
ncbi:hypothetical protein COU15_01125, partial [Candidatus Kaiserbacteria bacterium CG10_big_fil_rev_8_21_14_0_10_45_20]